MFSKYYPVKYKCSHTSLLDNYGNDLLPYNFVECKRIFAWFAWQLLYEPVQDFQRIADKGYFKP